MSEPVHVGVRVAGARIVAIELMLEPQLAQASRADVVKDHHEMTHVLVVHERLHGDREHAEQPEIDQLEAEQVFDIEQRLEVCVPLAAESPCP